MASNCGKDAGRKIKKCVKERVDKVRKCTQTRDEGYNRCTRTRDEGYEKCCDWAPCSWFCDIVVWVANIVCIAWEWVKNIVCVAWEWVKNVVCVAWIVLSTGLCRVTDVLTSALNLLATALEAALNWALSIVGFVVGILQMLPGLGRIISWIWGVVGTIINGILSLPDAVLTLFGIMPEKRLRLAVVMLRDSQRNFIVKDRKVILRAIQYAIHQFRTEVNVRVIPIQYASYQTAFADDPTAGDAYIFEYDIPSTAKVLDTCCDECAAVEDLGPAGTEIQTILNRLTFWGNGRRLLTYGAPLVALTVRSFRDGKMGCSLGPLSDYVTVLFQDSDTTIAIEDLTPDKSLGSITDLTHELGHACNLPHKEDVNNLMNPSPARTGSLTVWQKILVRASRHVTYF